MTAQHEYGSFPQNTSGHFGPKLNEAEGRRKSVALFASPGQKNTTAFFI